MDHLDASVRGAGGSDIELVQNLLFYDVNISNIHCRVTIQMCACVWRGEERGRGMEGYGNSISIEKVAVFPPASSKVC